MVSRKHVRLLNLANVNIKKQHGSVVFLQLFYQQGFLSIEDSIYFLFIKNYHLNHILAQILIKIELKKRDVFYTRNRKSSK